jgi:hypothetical protein
VATAGVLFSTEQSLMIAVAFGLLMVCMMGATFYGHQWLTGRVRARAR